MTQDHKHPPYMAIFGTLAGLTLIELVLASVLHAQKTLLIVLLVALALVKAALVAAYFMHLRFEKKTFVVIVCFPLVLAVVLVLGLMPDVGFMRSLVHSDNSAPAAAPEHK